MVRVARLMGERCDRTIDLIKDDEKNNIAACSLYYEISQTYWKRRGYSRVAENVATDHYSWKANKHWEGFGKNIGEHFQR